MSHMIDILVNKPNDVVFTINRQGKIRAWRVMPGGEPEEIDPSHAIAWIAGEDPK